MNFNVAKNLERIKEGIAEACEPSGRNPDDVIIVGVTKYFDHKAIVAAVRDGVRHIGENRPMDIRDKFPLADAELEELIGPGKHYQRHMIGHLQRNKVKAALGMFDMIQSLDSIPLAEEIQKVAENVGREKVECLIELNISGEAAKTGMNVLEIDELVATLNDMDRIYIRGIMGMPPYFPDPEEARNFFVRLTKAFEILKKRESERFEMKYLSMGMSHDFKIAVEEGANMVRIGQALFERE
jgi:pyridoxal phosphate enzyme (YggS family)